MTERQGALVARELEKLMDGTSRGPNLLPWTYHVLVPRESTSPVAPAAQLIRRALALIDRRAALQGPHGPDDARLAHASVRLSWRCERDVEQGRGGARERWSKGVDNSTHRRAARMPERTTNAVPSHWSVVADSPRKMPASATAKTGVK